MKILITGSAGFIGFYSFLKFREAGFDVVGLDNINDYYDVNLKLGRLRICGVDTDMISTGKLQDCRGGGRFIKLDLTSREKVEELFRNEKFDLVCHLAAQPGVRYSMENPYAYIDSNIVAMLNILECCRHNNIQHLVYASSSSVYGSNSKIPFSETDNVDHPISLYAATKKSDELMAYCYSHLFKIRATGLRFFTVYGPWGRADMAMFQFTKNILAGKPVKVFNHGDMRRDFTYIDDIVNGIYLAATQKPKNHDDLYSIYNIGNGKPVALMDFIRAIEKYTGKKAMLELLPLQPGDVHETWADTSALSAAFDYVPKVDIDTGVRNFVEWYKSFYKC